ncbi:MAG: hypothetical protein WEE89_19825 [Gemmatimonadota bacterium]
MALHEEAELRALRGELSELEHAWRDADEIAAIADNLLTPCSIQNAIDRLRRKTEWCSTRLVLGLRDILEDPTARSPSKWTS